MTPHHMTHDQMYNIDETGLLLRLIPIKILVREDEKVTQARKPEKAQLTFLGSGEQNLNL